MGACRLGQLFNLSSIATVGAGPRLNSSGGLILEAIRSDGYRGRLRAVNPKHRDIAFLGPDRLGLLNPLARFDAGFADALSRPGVRGCR